MPAIIQLPEAVGVEGDPHSRRGGHVPPSGGSHAPTQNRCISRSKAPADQHAISQEHPLPQAAGSSCRRGPQDNTNVTEAGLRGKAQGQGAHKNGRGERHEGRYGQVWEGFCYATHPSKQIREEQARPRGRGCLEV